ncbi:MAG TPA: DUF2177 family protein [Spirochaetia bacterium]|nr:DUF2177 family protein [Spirochaetia bacterium]
MLNTLQFAKLYLLTLPVFLLIDGLWLTVIAKNFYAKYLGYLMTPSPNWFAASIFYFGYVIGIIIFAVSPALQENSLTKALVLGGLFGMFCYATYDLTNLATIKDWPWFVAVIDIVWGTLVSLIVAGAGFYIGKKII